MPIVSFTPIIPRPFRFKHFWPRLGEAMTKVGEEASNDFNQKTTSWRGARPNFAPTVLISPPEIKLTIRALNSAGSAKWIFLDQGTKDHFIEPSPAGRPSRQNPSRPGAIKFAVAGVGFAFSKGHTVKGIKAKRWSNEIIKKWDRQIQDRLNDSLKQSVIASGHSLIGKVGRLFGR